MRNLRRKLFPLLCTLSLLLAVALVWMWIRSFGSDWTLLRFETGGEKYSLQSHWGRLILLGPPADQLEDPAARQLVELVSTDDFDWTRYSPGLLMGTLRQSTPTWQLFHQFWKRRRAGKGIEPAVLNSLPSALEDPHRFASAQFLLRLAIGETREARRHPRETNFIFLILSQDTAGITLRAHSNNREPDFSRRGDTHAELNQLLNVQRASVFDGWLVLPALLLPLTTATRPRYAKKTWKRWLFNAVALPSFIICIATTVMWFRSYWVEEEWTFERRIVDYP